MLSLRNAEVTGMHHHFLQVEHFCWWKCLSNACAGEKGCLIPVKALMVRLYFRVCSHLGFHLSVGDNYIVILGGELSVGSFLFTSPFKHRCQFCCLVINSSPYLWMPDWEWPTLLCSSWPPFRLGFWKRVFRLPPIFYSMQLLPFSFFKIKIKHCCNLGAVDLFCLSCEIVWE